MAAKNPSLVGPTPRLASMVVALLPTPRTLYKSRPPPSWLPVPFIALLRFCLPLLCGRLLNGIEPESRP